MHLVLIGLGGFAGAVARYLVDGWVTTWTRGAFPWGTMAVNLSGSFLLGIGFAVTVEHALLPAGVRGPLLIGFLGAYTTFSTLALESWRLAEDGAMLQAIGNLGGSLVLGVVALVMGIGLGRMLA